MNTIPLHKCSARSRIKCSAHNRKTGRAEHHKHRDQVTHKTTDPHKEMESRMNA